MDTVAQILKRKGHHIWSVSPDTSVLDATRLMAEKNIGSVLVIEDGRVQGIFSERDLARRVVAQGLDPATTPVSEVMTHQVLCIDPKATAEEVLAVMTEKRLRHLPVREGDKLLGVVSIGDAVKSIIEHHQCTIQQLVNYITGAETL